MKKDLKRSDLDLWVDHDGVRPEVVMVEPVVSEMRVGSGNKMPKRTTVDLVVTKVPVMLELMVPQGVPMAREDPHMPRVNS